MEGRERDASDARDWVGCFSHLDLLPGLLVLAQLGGDGVLVVLEALQLELAPGEQKTRGPRRPSEER